MLVEVSKLSKQYTLGPGMEDNLRAALMQGIRNAWRGAGDRQKSVFWALEDISFSLDRGEVLGVIGSNGAGKSTLLKILSRVTLPSSGRALLRGRVGSLLEVGTGFHPDLSGRENIFFNGALLGMRQAEIRGKLDEIVAFSGVERFIDLPVRKYSSGMYVRLAFSVAAHLETEILLIDEVLAVGDIAFQKKCIGKMEDVLQEGKAIVFISHNLGLVRQLCSRAMVLEQGRNRFLGSVDDAIQVYAKACLVKPEEIRFQGKLSDRVQVKGIRLNGRDPFVQEVLVSPGDSLRFECWLELEAFERLRVDLALFVEGMRLCTVHDYPEGASCRAGLVKLWFDFPGGWLRPGMYFVGLGGQEGSKLGDWFWKSDVFSFVVIEEWVAGIHEVSTGCVNVSIRGRREYVSGVGATGE